MPFYPGYKYGTNSEVVTHASVPPPTRCCGPREHEDSTFTFDSTEESEVDVPNVLK